MSAVWLFLYLGSLVQMLTLYRLDANHPATLLMLLPILALPWMDKLGRHQSWLLGKAALRGAGLVSLLSAAGMARVLNLGFWETRHLGLAVLCMLTGLGLMLVLPSSQRERSGPGTWIWIAAWSFTGSWHPVLPFLGAGVSAFLAGFGRWPDGAELTPSDRRVPPFWTMLLLGLVLPKPWFDFNLDGTWAVAMAAFALAVGATAQARLRASLDRVPSPALILMLALAFVAYPSGWVLVWAAILGLIWGGLWPRLPRPLPMPRLSFGFILGLLLSYTLHSNLGVPFLRRLLWWGS